MPDYQLYLHLLEMTMQQFIDRATCHPSFVYDMIKYHMGWVNKHFERNVQRKGKRLRPLLLLLCCEALSEKWHHALPAAMAVEFLHNFTLIHDDIEDRDEMRRGQPTLWSLWGVPQAINAGDALYALAYQALLASTREVDCASAMTAAKVFTSVVLHITEGQCLDIGFEREQNITEDAYLNMIMGKTAALLGLCSELGAILADADDFRRRKMRDFGIALGMAFQMQDDILGLWGNPDKTGKPVGSDLIKGKKTLPIIHCMQTSEEFLQVIASAKDPDTFDTAMAFLNRSDSYAYTENKVNAYLTTALEALDAALNPDRQKYIRPLLQNLVQRQQ